MIVNNDLVSTRPWASAAQKHHEAGWHVFPLPEKQKFPPETGRTGWGGTDRDGSDFDKVAVRRNVGLRMPVGVIGVDVDHYDGKKGGDVLAALESRLGALPAAPRLSSRYDPEDSTPDVVSGIRFYRVPGGTILAGDLGPAIETIQRHHRYAVAAPSVHPKTGRPYRWMDATGTAELEGVPKVEDLPDLPQAWIDEFQMIDSRSGSGGGGGTVANAGMIDLWLAGHRGWAPCAELKKRLGTFDEAPGSRHDSMVKTQLAVVSLAAGGHLGGTEALEELHEKFAAQLRGESGRDADYEFMSALAGAIGIIAANPPKAGGCCTLTFGRSVEVELQEPADFADVLIRSAGQHPSLGGLYSYGRRLVTLPLIGEAGYVAPMDPRDHDGLAQIMDMDAADLVAFVHSRWYVYRIKVLPDGRLRKVHEFTPFSSATTLLRRAKGETDIPVLRGVTHTPVLKIDGTVLQQPGYDTASGLTFMPAPGTKWPEIPVNPSGAEIEAAADLLCRIVGQFPWVCERDRNNFLALWLTPLVLPMLRDAGPMGIITAPSMGSGKSLLAKVLQATHGAVLRGKLPAEQEEIRKQITTILLNTAAPVVVWDNVDQVVDSGHLATLTTKPTWSDRVLGQNREVELPAKRVWIANGNNIQLGGDMARRGLWIEIDPGMPEPWKRTMFEHPDLHRWVEDNRGEVLGALLTLVVAWVQAGRPAVLDRTDSFSEWFGVLGGILQVAGLGEIGNGARDLTSQGLEDLALAELLSAAWPVFDVGEEDRTRLFTARELAEACRGVKGGYSEVGEALPQELHDKFREVGFIPGSLSKSLGFYLSSVERRWTNEGLSIERSSGGGDRAKKYRILRKGGGSSVTAYAPGPSADAPETEKVSSAPPKGEKNSSCDKSQTNHGVRPNRHTAGTRPALGGMVAFDFETLSADRLWREEPRQDYVRCLSVSDGTSHYLTFDHDEMREILTEAKWLVAHNAYGFDVHVAARHLGLDFEMLIDKCYDTKLLSYLVFPAPSQNPETQLRTPDISRHLDDLAQTLCGYGKTEPITAIAARAMKALPKDQRPADKYEAIDWTLDENAGYALRDSEITYALYLKLVGMLPDNDYARRETRIGRLAAGMTWRGVPVDMQRAIERVAEDEANLERLRAKLHDDWGVETRVKLTSAGAIRVGEIMRQEAGIEPVFGKKTFKGDPVPLLSKEAIGMHAGRLDVGDLVRSVLEVNAERKLPHQLLELVGTDGRVHPTVTMGQATGRWSVQSPGMTTFGKRGDRKLRDRELIRAADGFVLHCEDYSSIDVRGMAALSGDPHMVEMLQPGLDWHRQIAELVWGDPSRREDAKALSHAINYKCGPATIASTAGVTEMEARNIISAIDTGFPALAAFKKAVADGASAGEETTNGWGRRLNVDTVRAVTQAPGLAGQSWARDAVMEGLLRLDDAGLSRYVVLHIHDEYVLEIPAERAEELRPKIHDALTFDRDGVPVLSEPSNPPAGWDPAVWISHYKKEAR